MQYEGLIEELIGDAALHYKEIYWKKNPEAKQWADKENIAYLKITPTWIRYTDLNKHPWDIFEISF